MDIIIEWITKYSPPIVGLIVVGAVFLFLIKKTTEKALDEKFYQIKAEREKRSRFEERLLIDKYQLVEKLFNKLVRVESDLKRYRAEGIAVDGLLLGSDVVPLTQVCEELRSKRYLIGDRFYALLETHYDLVKEIAVCSTEEDYQKIKPKYDQHIDEFNEAAIEEFDIRHNSLILNKGKA